MNNPLVSFKKLIRQGTINMKKNIAFRLTALTILLSLTATFAYSQTITIGAKFEAGLQFNYTKSRNGYKSSIGTKQGEMLTVSTFIVPNIELVSGIGLGQYSHNYKNTVNNDMLLTQQNRLEAPLFMRYYFPSEKRIQAFIGLGAQYSLLLNSNSTIVNDGIAIEQVPPSKNHISIMLNAGAALHLNSKNSLLFSLINYTNTTKEYESNAFNTKSNTVCLQLAYQRVFRFK